MAGAAAGGQRGGAARAFFMSTTKMFWAVAMFALGAVLAARGAHPVIEDGRYANDAAAQAAWKPMKGSAPATISREAGAPAVRLPCNFAGTDFERVSWDRAVKVDLAAGRGVRFEFFCPNLEAISQFSLYFQSGDGWYAATFQPEIANAWTTITVNKSAMRAEGKPAGWGKITTIRVSAWRGQNTDTEMRLRNFGAMGVLGVDADVAIIRAETAARGDAGEAKSVDQFASAVAEGFEAWGIGCATPGDDELTAAQLRGAKLVVLPYNPAMPAQAVHAVKEYLRDGGRLLAFYHVPEELQADVNISLGKHVKAGERLGKFAAMQFGGGAGALVGAPKNVRQRSWNIREVKPAGEGARVVAEWLDEKGERAGYAAVVASKNAVVMSHVLLGDDLANKRRMLLAMAAALAPELWPRAVAAGIAKIGEVGGSRNVDEAAATIMRLAGEQGPAMAKLAEACERQVWAQALSGAGKFAEALDEVPVATQRMLEAYCLAQTPRAGEFRAFWCHSALGVEGLTWDEAIKRLAEAGFTAILPNMLWGGVAYYPSKVLPVAGEVATRGDQIAECLAACKKYGVEMHVWKVNWNTGHRVPKEFLERMRSEGRLQESAKGKVEPWLCPSHPENQALEIAAMVEVARDYDVAGIHFDYIRYPDGDHCYCAGCRARFGKVVGAEITAWPKAVLAGGEWRQRWLEWRRENINAVVRAVSEQARAAKPTIKISAAVFRNWTTDRDGVGQDWKLWCERGWLDFVCPMDYTGSERQLDTWVGLQKTWAGKVPVYPGIGVSSSTSRLTADRVIRQIEITRRHDTGGFVLFNYGQNESGELLPLLGAGVTKKVEK